MNTQMLSTPLPDTETPYVTRRASRLWRTPMFWLGILLFVALSLFCFVGPVVYPESAFTLHMSAVSHPPSAAFPLGTDDLGRNEMSRLMLGGQLLILVGLAAAIIATLLGTIIGLATGLSGGLVDEVGSWLMDIVLSVPQLVPILLIANLLRPSSATMIVVVGATSWPLVARLVRAETLSIRQREYVAAARSLGARDFRIMVRHVLPNLWSTILVATSSSVGTAVLVVATASFLGFTLPPPWPNWSGMIADSLTSSLFSDYWWLLVFPGAALVLLQLSINFIADATSETLHRHQEVS